MLVDVDGAPYDTEAAQPASVGVIAFRSGAHGIRRWQVSAALTTVPENLLDRIDELPFAPTRR